MSNIATQNARVLTRLKTKKKVSNREILFDLGITRGAARIYDLKQQGHKIATVGKDKFGFQEYSLEQ